MPDLKALVAELEGVRQKAQAIVDEHKDGLPAEQKAEFDRLMERAAELRGQIEEAQEYERKRRDLAALDRFLNDPQYRVPRGAVGNDGAVADDGRKALLDAGWECKDGGWYAPTSTGERVAMYADEVLFGPLPEDKDAAAYFKATRAAFQPEYRQVFTKFLREAIKHRSESMAFARLEPHEQKALSEGSDTAGGFLVPPDTQAEMLVRLAQRAVMRRLARVVNTSRDTVVFPRVLPHDTDGSIYSSGFVGDWAGETPAFTDTDPKFGQFQITIKKLRVATRLSNDLIADAVFNVLAFLAQNGAENMALVEDKGFIAGDGTALQPRGILASGASTVDVEGSTANTISNSTSNAGSAPKLIDLVYALPSQYADRAQWLMRRSTEGAIRKLVDAQNRFLWPAMSGSGFAAAPRDLMGYPVNNSEFMPADGTDGAKVLVFGDIGGAYVIAQRAQITTTILRERFADTDQVGIILFERVGGDTWNPDAIRIGDV